MILQVITGPMMAGKSSRLIEEVTLWRLRGREVLLVKPSFDTRTEGIMTRSGIEVECLTIHGKDLGYVARETNAGVIAIDEAQFFTAADLMDGVRQAHESGAGRVIVAGLNRDFLGEPFASMAAVLPHADEIETLAAVCTHDLAGVPCGRPATHTQRLVGGQPVIEATDTMIVDGDESYAPRCWSCFQVA